MSENTLAGAILYNATAGKAFLRIFDNDRGDSFTVSETLADGTTRNLSGVRNNADKLGQMHGFTGAPSNLQELLADGLDLGIPVSEAA